MSGRLLNHIIILTAPELHSECRHTNTHQQSQSCIVSTAITVCVWLVCLMQFNI